MSNHNDKAGCVQKSALGRSSWSWLGVAALGALLTYPASVNAQSAGQVDPSNDSVPVVAPVEGGYLVNGGQPGDWAFMMGPTGSEQMQLKLIKANADKSGGVGFMCSRADGSMQLAVVVPGATYEVGKPRDLDVTVGDKTNKLKVAVHMQPKPGMDAVFEAAGLPVPAILDAMAHVDEIRSDARLSFDAGDGHKASFLLTKPRTVAGQASQVCSGWAMAALKRTHPEVSLPTGILPVPATPALVVPGLTDSTPQDPVPLSNPPMHENPGTEGDKTAVVPPAGPESPTIPTTPH